MREHGSEWSIDRKEFLQQSSRLDEASFRESDGLCLSPWIGDESLFMQTVHGLPIEALPDPIDVMKPKTQQGQNGSVDLVIVQSSLVSG